MPESSVPGCLAMSRKYGQKSILKEFRSISNLIQSIAVESDDGPAEPSLQQLLKARWAECAGRAAPWSFPLLFRSGRLVIFTESAIWATELRHQRQTIENGLRDLDINQITVRASPGIFPRNSRRTRKLRLSRGNGQNMSKTALKLKHPGLREAVIRLSRRSDDH
jgi:hypothetical protein